MKKELIYILNCYALNVLAMLIVLFAFGTFGIVATNVISAVIASIIVATFTTSASLLALCIWLKMECVFLSLKTRPFRRSNGSRISKIDRRIDR